MSSRDDMIPGKAQIAPGRRWKRCVFRDLGDGTAFVLIGREYMVGGRLRFLGKEYTIPMAQVRPEKERAAG